MFLFFSDLITLHKRIEKDEKEILDKEFYKKKYEKFLEEKENNLDKEKTGFTKSTDKKDLNNPDDNKGKKNAQINQIKLGGKAIADNKKKKKNIKDKYERIT